MKTKKENKKRKNYRKKIFIGACFFSSCALIGSLIILHNNSQKISSASGKISQSHPIQKQGLPFINIINLAAETPKSTPIDPNEPQNDVSNGAGNLSVNVAAQSYFGKTSDIDWYSFTALKEDKQYVIETLESKDNAVPQIELYKKTKDAVDPTKYNDEFLEIGLRKTDSKEIYLSFIPSKYLGNEQVMTLYVKVSNQLQGFPNNDLNLYAYKIRFLKTPMTVSESEDKFEPDNLPLTSSINTDNTSQDRNFHNQQDVDWLNFYVGFPESLYRIETFVKEGTQGDTVLQLYSPSFNVQNPKLSTPLFENDNKNPSSLGSLIIFRPVDAGLGQGIYYLKVAPKYPSINYGPNATYLIKASYSTEALPTPSEGDKYEPNNTVDTASEINAGETQSHNFHNQKDIDWVQFYAPLESYVYTIETTNLGQKADTVLKLYDSDQTTLIAQNDNINNDTVASKIAFSPEKHSGNAIYYLNIYPKNPYINTGEKSNYDLKVAFSQPTTTPIPASPIPFSITPDQFEIEPELLDTIDNDKPEAASWIIDINTNSAYHNFHKSQDIDWLSFNISLIGRYRIFVSNTALMYLYNSSLKGHLATNNPKDQAYYETLPQNPPASAATLQKRTEKSFGIKGLNIEASKLHEPSLSSMIEYNFYYPGTYYLKLSPRNDTNLSKSSYHVKIIPLIPVPIVSPIAIKTPLAQADGFDTAVNFSDDLPETARPFFPNWERHYNSLHDFRDQDWKTFLITSAQKCTFKIDNPGKGKLQLKIFRVFSDDDDTQTGIFEWIPWGKVTYPDSDIKVNVEVIKNLYIDSEAYFFDYNFIIPGTYYIGFMNPDDSPKKYYRLLIFTEKDYVSSADIWDQWLPVDNSANTASYILPNGIEQKHTFSDITDQDWITFNAEKNQQYSLFFAGRIKTHVYLFQKTENGLKILNERNFQNSDRLDFTAIETDSYYLHFTPSNDSASLSNQNEYLVKIFSKDLISNFPNDTFWNQDPNRIPTATSTITSSASPLPSNEATKTNTNTFTITLTPTPTFTPTITFTPTSTNTLHPFFLTPNTYNNRVSVLVLLVKQTPAATTESLKSPVIETPTVTETPIIETPIIETQSEKEETAITSFISIPLQGAKVSLSSLGKYQYTDYNGQTTFENVADGKYTVFAEYNGLVKMTDIETNQQRYAKIIFYQQNLASGEPNPTLPLSGIILKQSILIIAASGLFILLIFKSKKLKLKKIKLFKFKKK